MDDQDYNFLYNFLVDILNQREMGWVVDQVSEQIRLGKTEATQIAPSQDIIHQSSFPGMDVKRRRTSTRRPERFLLTTNYTPKERLVLLIDAIEQAVVNTNLMVQDTLNFFSEQFRIKQITFYSQENQTSKDFDLIEFDQRRSQVATLKHLIDDLRRRINAY